MPISKTIDVFSLIKSLSKSEKRSFRLFAERIQGKDELLYMRLFDIMEKQKVLDDLDIFQRMGTISKGKYSNIKRHLYEQILTSLRLVEKAKKPNIKIREQIDFAFVLYGRGLYMQALKSLERAKSLAHKYQLDFPLLTIVETEKMIHSRHITRSKSHPIEDMIDASSATVKTIMNRVKLSNLRLMIQKSYVENGHVKSEQDELKVIHLFKEKIDEVDESALGQMEHVYLAQAKVWYYYTLLDYHSCLKYAKEWVALFDEDADLQVRDINLYFRGFNYVLLCAFYLSLEQDHFDYLQRLEKFRKENYLVFNKNSQILSFLYVHSGRLNHYFLKGNFDVGVNQLGRTIARLERYKNKLDDHRVLVFYYKIAWMYLGNGEPTKAIKYLQQIINMTNTSLRIDIQAYSRLMFLMVHYELKNEGIMPFMLRSYNGFFKKNDVENKMQKELMLLFNALIKSPILPRKSLMEAALKHLEDLQKIKYEKKGFLYLDAISWIKSILQSKTIGLIIKESKI